MSDEGSTEAERAERRIADARELVAMALRRWVRYRGKGWQREVLAAEALRTALGELSTALATGPRATPRR